MGCRVIASLTKGNPHPPSADEKWPSDIARRMRAANETRQRQAIVTPNKGLVFNGICLQSCILIVLLQPRLA